MKLQSEQNKASVIRFNKEFIELGNLESFQELVADDVINHSAPAGTAPGPESMSYFILHVLRNALSDIKIDILDQVAEGDKVTTRKTLHATHTGVFMGVPPSNKKVSFDIIDIIRLRDGKYIEHWGISNIPQVLQQVLEK